MPKDYLFPQAPGSSVSGFSDELVLSGDHSLVAADFGKIIWLSSFILTLPVLSDDGVVLVAGPGSTQGGATRDIGAGEMVVISTRAGSYAISADTVDVEAAVLASAAADATTKAAAAEAAAIAAAASDATSKANAAESAAIAAAEADATSKADAAEVAAIATAAADATTKADAAQAAAEATAAADATTKADAAEAAAIAAADADATTKADAAQAAAEAQIPARALVHDAAQSLSESAKTQALKNLGAVSKNNLEATEPPTVNNDSSEGYEVGSLWISTQFGVPIPIPPVPPGSYPAPLPPDPVAELPPGIRRIFICVSPSAGDAEWHELVFPGYSFQLGDASTRDGLFAPIHLTSEILYGAGLEHRVPVDSLAQEVLEPAGRAVCMNSFGMMPGRIQPSQILGMTQMGKDILVASSREQARAAIGAKGSYLGVQVVSAATFSLDDSHAGKVLIFTNAGGCAVSIPLPTQADRRIGVASSEAIDWTAVDPGPEGNQIRVYTSNLRRHGDTEVTESGGSVYVAKSLRARLSIAAGTMAVDGVAQVVPTLIHDGLLDGQPSYVSASGWLFRYVDADGEVKLTSPDGDQWSAPFDPSGTYAVYPDEVDLTWVPVTTGATGAPGDLTPLTSSAEQVHDAAVAAGLSLVTSALVGDGSASFPDVAEGGVLLTGGAGTSPGFNFKIAPRGGDVTLSVDATEDLNGVTGGSGVISQGFKELSFLTQAEGDHLVFGDIGTIS